VTEIDANNRKLTLSVVDYFKNRETAELEAWKEAHKPGTGATLADAAAASKKKKKKVKKETSETASEE
jgi:small subunit ribosomal protein S1